MTKRFGYLNLVIGICLVIVSWLLVISCAFADDIRMKGGRTVKGLITEEKDEYVIVAIPGGGEFKIKKSDITSINSSNEKERAKLKDDMGKTGEEALKNGRDKMNYGGARHSSADSVPTVLKDSKRTQDVTHITADDSAERKETFSILQERRKAKVRAVTGISKKKARDEKK